MTQDRLERFLIDVALDAALLAEFMENPQPLMDRWELSAEEKEAVLSGDPMRIQTRLLGPEQPDPDAPKFVIVYPNVRLPDPSAGPEGSP